MPTRPRTGSSRTKKTAAPLPSSDELQHSSSDEASAATSSGEEAAAGSEVTATRLERRDIPSFSMSREARIAEAAYWRAERRGFAAGHELDDWLEAEKEIDGDLQAEQARQTQG